MEEWEELDVSNEVEELDKSEELKESEESEELEESEIGGVEGVEVRGMGRVEGV